MNRFLPVTFLAMTVLAAIPDLAELTHMIARFAPAEIRADPSHLAPGDVGYFDIVLFFGVLYHLKHPMLALERVCELTTDLACVESFVTDDQPSGTIPSMEFYEGRELAGQFDNWVGPNISCLLAMCRTAGFARVEFQSVADARAHVICHRKWPEIARRGAGPDLFVVENSELQNHSFTAHRDDYVTVWFYSERPGITCDDVSVQVGPYGTRPAAVSNIGNTWQANCKLPLGLAPGWHNVSVALGTSEFSSPVRIAVDLPREERVGTPFLVVVENSELQNHNFTAQGEDYLTASISSEELDLTCDNILVQVGPHRARPEAVRRVGATWQADCKLPPGLAPGWYDVSVTVRDSAWSNRARIAVDLPRASRVATAANASFEIKIVCDGLTWERKQVRAGLGSCVSAWVSGLPDGIRRTDVSFRLDGTDLPASFVTPLDDEQGMKQINAMVPPGLERGEYQLTVRFGEQESPAVRIELF